MKTPTHLAINWLILKRLNISESKQYAVLLGGVAPDLAIILVFSLLAVFVHPFDDALALFRSWYETSPWLIGLHNLLHSPVSLLGLLLLSFLAGAYQKQFEWFLAGAFVHTFIDIYTHVDDGPLVFWPFNSEYRFQSLLSHWHPDYYGREMLIAECLLLAAVAFVLLRRFYKYYFRLLYIGQFQFVGFKRAVLHP